MMKIQTFQNGELIEEREVDSFLPTDWDAYNRAFLINAAYNRVAQATTNRAAVRRLEIIAISAGISNEAVEINIFIILWNSMIDATPQEAIPTTEEVEEWRAIALAAGMDFRFIENGKIALI
ncbi:hypothetical protein [Nostoc sp.]|uniref:hypothetical protein n=1 Tax=Nostoc sp. TaxID=1180 RepID=UPI002FFC7ADA